VISVHMLCLDDCFEQPSCHKRLKSLDSFSVSLFLVDGAMESKVGGRLTCPG
jgi:hypothetical protein